MGADARHWAMLSSTFICLLRRLRHSKNAPSFGARATAALLSNCCAGTASVAQSPATMDEACHARRGRRVPWRRGLIPLLAGKGVLRTPVQAVGPRMESALNKTSGLVASNRPGLTVVARFVPSPAVLDAPGLDAGRAGRLVAPFGGLSRSGKCLANPAAPSPSLRRKLYPAQVHARGIVPAPGGRYRSTKTACPFTRLCRWVVPA